VPRLAARSVAATCLAVALALALAAGASADAPDYPIAKGHFYRQAAGGESGARGFAVTDEEGVPFWSEYQRLGGVDALGYPISRRFVLHGLICQATQRAILQWHPGEKRVRLINVMEYLSDLGVDEALAKHRLVPRPVGAVLEASRESWLESNAKIKTVYFGASDPVALFGLPLSPPVEMGPAVAMRFQRGVIYAWKERQPWTGAEQVSVANAGDFVKEWEGLPARALEPEAPPPVREIVQASRGGPREETRISGVATWYGEDFQGSPMANGEPFDRHDPGIAASNMHRLGTWLKVTRVATGKSIKVRVTDRGAFRMPIVVDLSQAAFTSLADTGDGVIRVVVEPWE
jgi:rare lipoprotein A